MAQIKVFYICPVCKASHDKQSDAIACRNKHPIRTETWAVGKEKMVRIYDHCASDGLGGMNWALREADLSDNIETRKRQIKEETHE